MGSTPLGRPALPRSRSIPWSGATSTSRASCRWPAGPAPKGLILRFIEYMDVGHSNGWRMDDVVPAAEIVERIGAEMPLEPLPPNYPGEVADRWRYRDGSGEVGVIASVSQPVLRRLHPGPDLRRGSTLHVPVRRPGTRPPGAAAGRPDRRRDRGSDQPGVARTRRSLLRPAHGRDRRAPRPAACPRSRCSRWGAEATPERSVVHPSSTAA